MPRQVFALLLAAAPCIVSLMVPAQPGLFHAKERLFGAARPELIFWRDSAGWCPFCEMTWLLLESMAVPYRVRTVPLRRYMLDGEVKDPEYTSLVGLDGVVPGVQFREADDNYGRAVQSVESIFEELRLRYPENYPSGDQSTRVRACEGETSIFGRMRVARRSYEACAGAASSELAVLGPLAIALQQLDELLAESECVGPFLGGTESPTVADLMVLPFLERTAAVVPYFFGSDALSDECGVRFDRAAAYLERARTLYEPYKALCSDATTLARTNLRYAEAGEAPRYSVPTVTVDEAAAAEIDGTCERIRDLWVIQATMDARRRAATRLATNPSGVAAFSRRCAKLPKRSGSDEEADAVVDALRAVATLLLEDGVGEARLEELHAGARAAAETVRGVHGSDGAADAAEALAALSLNVGVPRDMDVEAARALRSHARIFAAELGRK